MASRLLLGLLLCGLCPAAQAAPLNPPVRPRLPTAALRVPIVEQMRSYSCGAAALLSVLKYWDAFHGSERKLYKLLKPTYEYGISPETLAIGARYFGLTGEVRQPMTITDLRGVLADGYTVIIELQAWRGPLGQRLPWSATWDDGHYAVLIGLDEFYAYFMDPSTGDAYTYVPLGELLARWHDINPGPGTPHPNKDFQLGIVIKGKAPSPLPKASTPLLRMD